QDQTAHISLQILAISKSERQNQPEAPFSLAQPASAASVLFALGPSKHPLRRSVWRSVVRLSAAGEGVFTDGARDPQGLFADRMRFFWTFCEVLIFSWVYEP
ncbi:MAG: hypothetical protein AAF366_10440, partial [Pseudomonadota bacterium]